MREIYEVNLDTADPFEIAALIIASWACPAAKEKDLRGRLYLSLCAWFIRDRAARDPDWAQQPQWLCPNQACRAEADIKRDFKTLDRRIKDRVDAGHMAIAFLLKAETGSAPTAALGVSRLSINQLADRAAAARGMSEGTNFKSRVWAASRPVIHVSAAWAVIAQGHFKEHGTHLVLHEVMRRPEFLARLLALAQTYEALVARSEMHISAEELIKFRPASGVGSK